MFLRHRLHNQSVLQISLDKESNVLAVQFYSVDRGVTSLFNPVLKYWKSHLWAALNRNHLVEESISDSKVPHVLPTADSDTTRNAWMTTDLTIACRRIDFKLLHNVIG